MLEPVVAGAKYYEVVNTSEWDVWIGELADISAPSHRSGGGTFPPYGVAQSTLPSTKTDL
jgi:hypothetical protein